MHISIPQYMETFRKTFRNDTYDDEIIYPTYKKSRCEIKMLNMDKNMNNMFIENKNVNEEKTLLTKSFDSLKPHDYAKGFIHCYDLKKCKDDTIYLNLDLECVDEKTYKKMSSHIKHIIFFRTISTPIAIINKFLSNAKFIESVDFSNVTNVIKIEDNFLKDCASLKKANLLGFDNVKYIGNNFLQNCTALEYVNLSSFCNVKIIGDSFLHYSRRLKNIDLSSFINLISIGKHFLRSSAITSIDLTSFKNVINIDRNFLIFCNNLITIDIAPLEKLDCIPSDFMYGCSQLKHLQMSKPGQIKYIDRCFLYRSGIEIIDRNVFENVQSIGWYFMAYSEIETFDFTMLDNCKIIQDYIFCDCQKLTTPIPKDVEVKIIRYDDRFNDNLNDSSNDDLEQ